MQYISEAIVLRDTKVEYNYSDMFSMFKKKIEEINEGCVEYTQLVSFCMETMTSDCISLDLLEEMSVEYLEEAMDTLEEVRTILISNKSTDFREIPIKDIPPHLHKFFKAERDINFFKQMSNAKVTRNKRKRKNKSKLFF